MDKPLLPVDATLAALHWRYATKKFDPARKLSAEEWSKLEAALILAPSSWGIQPYKFVVVTEPELRQKLRAAAFNQPQITDASHLVVFCARTGIEDADVDHYLDRIVEVRGVDRAQLGDTLGKMMKGDLVTGPRHPHVHQWAARQTYIALGLLLTVASISSIDACPMEGFVPDQFDEILGLKAQGFRSVVLGAVGHRAADDGAANVPKVRKTAADLVDHRA
jgi:nitroreductase